MANLSTKKWVRYEPALPGNLELPEAQRFYLEVCAGLTVAELDALRESVPAVFSKRAESAAEGTLPETEAAFAKDLEAAFAPAVRMGREPLAFDGVPIATLGEYLAHLSNQASVPLVRELMACINHHNSWEGLRQLFSVRSFGGTTGTAASKTEPAENQTAAR